MEDKSKLGSWVKMGHVKVPGNPFALSREEDPGMESWLKVAIMRVEPQVPALAGFIGAFSPIPVMYSLIFDDPLFGMRPGPEDVIFLARAQHASQHIELILVEVTDIDNPNYAAVPLF